MKEQLPEGWEEITAGVYLSKSEGRVWIEAEVDDRHDCDFMGCSAANHWAFKFRVSEIRS